MSNEISVNGECHCGNISISAIVDKNKDLNKVNVVKKNINENKKISSNQTESNISTKTENNFLQVIEIKKASPSIEEIKYLLDSSPGIILEDDPKNNKYPMPIFAEGKNEVFVGRIRKDFSNPNTINLWIVADNLRKGAATNTIQIAEYIIKQNWK